MSSTGAQPADPYKAKNADEPGLKEKVEDLAAFVDKCKFCMLTTTSPGGGLASRAMALAAREDNGIDFIFHTNTESGKTDDIEAHPEVNLGFLNSSGEWASISGKATVETDRSRIEKHYSPALKAWLGDLGDGTHDGGPGDPRIGLIKVTTTKVQYTISGKNLLAAALEVAKGVVTGEAPAVNKLRWISEAEVTQLRSS